MDVKELNLSILPPELQEIVMMYTYNLPLKSVKRSLDTIMYILDMKLPFFFLKRNIWSWHYHAFLPNPCRVFLPIEYFTGNYIDIFEDDTLYSLLLGLDFRRREVRKFGSRNLWMRRLCTCWKAVESFSSYYKMLLRTKTPILKKRSTIRYYFTPKQRCLSFLGNIHRP